MGHHHGSAPATARSGSAGDSSGAAAISGEASDSQGEVGSKQLGASAANQTRGALPYMHGILVQGYTGSPERPNAVVLQQLTLLSGEGLKGSLRAQILVECSMSAFAHVQARQAFPEMAWTLFPPLCPGRSPRSSKTLPTERRAWKHPARTMVTLERIMAEQQNQVMRLEVNRCKCRTGKDMGHSKLMCTSCAFWQQILFIWLQVC